MILKKDISIVVQGPIDNRTYETIDCYQDFGEVIISTWADEDLSLLDKAKSDNYIVCQTEYPDNVDTFINHGSCYFIAQTLYSGASVASNNHIIKTRSDELYPNLDVFLTNINRFPERLHTTDNGFWNTRAFCMSNHLFYERKPIILTATHEMIRYCSRVGYEGVDLSICEQIFGYFFMLSRRTDISMDTWKDVFRNNIFITKCADLKGHLHSGQTAANRGFKRSSDPYPSGRMELKNHMHDATKLYQHVDQIK